MSDMMDTMQRRNGDFSHLSLNSSHEEMLEYADFISNLHALPDGSPVPPASRHFNQAAKEGLGPSSYTVARVVGGIACVQEVLGFVTPEAVKQWSDFNFLENGHWLSHMIGTPEQPRPPTEPDIESASKLRIGPALKRITAQFGNLSIYHDRLGFVSRATLARWSDDEWVENGIWVSHCLGSPTEPKMPSQKDIKNASSLHISPSLDRIMEKYGSLPNYQRALGFSPRESMLDYANWTREIYIENGRWLSHLLGTPASPIKPTDNDIIEGSRLDLCPPITAIEKRFGRSLYKYQDAIGFVTPATLRRWSDQEWIENGRWFSILIGESPDKPKMPLATDLDAGSKLNITPSADAIREKYDDMYTYQEQLGFNNPNAPRKLTDRQMLAEGLKLLQYEQGSPLTTIQEYPKWCKITARTIQSRFGNITRFNELLGFPNYDHWGEDKILAFGVQWAVQHSGLPPTTKELTMLYRNHKGPSFNRVITVFDNLTSFKKAVIDALPQYYDLANTLHDAFGMSDELIRFLLRDFNARDGYGAQRLNLANDVTRLANSGTTLTSLVEIFSKGRLTALWTREDYLYFGVKAFYRKGKDFNDCLDRLNILDRAGLSPFFWEIEEVFGSIEAFIQASISPEGNLFARSSC